MDPLGKRLSLVIALSLLAVAVCCVWAAPETAVKRLPRTPVITCASTLCVRGSVCRETEFGPTCECYQCQTFAAEEPVCASDGRTYGGICNLEYESCKQKKPLVVVSKGKCPPKDRCKSKLDLDKD